MTLPSKPHCSTSIPECVGVRAAFRRKARRRHHSLCQSLSICVLYLDAFALARERVEGTDYFEQMCSAAAKHLENQFDCDEEDIDSAIATLEAEKDREYSQIQRFLNFLDDEALSRVRLTITFRIMEAIADNARSKDQLEYKLLAEYVNRVLILVTSSKEYGYTVDLTAHFANSAVEFDLSDELSKVIFYLVYLFVLSGKPKSSSKRLKIKLTVR